jgi:RNA polymerase sigma-70 factor (ECF subfamily)
MPLPPYFKKSVLFPTTRWTRVAELQAGSPEEAGRALEQLCGSYWYPVYAFLRRSGRNQEDAADLTQNFFFLRLNTVKTTHLLLKQVQFTSRLLMLVLPQ